MNSKTCELKVGASSTEAGAHEAPRKNISRGHLLHDRTVAITRGFHLDRLLTIAEAAVGSWSCCRSRRRHRPVGWPVQQLGWVEQLCDARRCSGGVGGELRLVCLPSCVGGRQPDCPAFVADASVLLLRLDRVRILMTKAVGQPHAPLAHMQRWVSCHTPLPPSTAVGCLKKLQRAVRALRGRTTNALW